jgi:hypothetical protein
VRTPAEEALAVHALDLDEARVAVVAAPVVFH